MARIKEKYELAEMPFDKEFETENGREMCHATGFEVVFEGDNTYWLEFVDSDGNYHYGR